MEQLKIEYLKIDELTPYSKNTRKHEDFDVKNIAKSIEKYGMNDPIGIWGKKNTIVEGHGRVLALKMLGVDIVPCIRLDHMTDKERREYGIAHNKTAELSRWDWDALDSEIADLNFDDFDFDFKHIELPEFDETNLDNDKVKNRVICSINFASVKDYEEVKERLQNIADEMNASIAVKMA